MALKYNSQIIKGKNQINFRSGIGSQTAKAPKKKNSNTDPDTQPVCDGEGEKYHKGILNDLRKWTKRMKSIIIRERDDRKRCV